MVAPDRRAMPSRAACLRTQATGTRRLPAGSFVFLPITFRFSLRPTRFFRLGAAFRLRDNHGKNQRLKCDQIVDFAFGEG